MGLLSSFKRIYKTDFQPQFQQLVDQLSYYINPNTEQLYQTLNNNVTLKDNIYCQIVNITVTVDVKGNVINSAGFSNTLASPIIGLMVINCTSTTGSNIYPTAGLFCNFVQNGNSISINNIQGLPANQQFNIKLVAFG